MNKTVKGSLAGAAGIALLMGGFGSYALWSESRPLASSSITTGDLTIGTDPSAAYWDDVNTPTVKDWSATDKMVPGDKVSYTQTFTVTGNGKNLKGTISLADPGALGGNSTLITRSIDITSSNTTITSDAAAPNTAFHFASPFGTSTMTAVVTYTFPAGTSGSTGTTDQNVSASTPATAFTISQG